MKPILQISGQVSALALLAALGALACPKHAAGADNEAKPRQAKAPRQSQSRNPRYEPEYEHRTFQGAADGELKYGWLAPTHVKAGEKYPLVICLHGAGGSVRASAILARREMREKYPSFVLVGECERPFVWAFADALKRPGLPEKPPEKLPVLIEAVRSLIKTEAVDPARIYITGQSMGGMGSWGAIARHPEMFAATTAG